MRKLLCLICVLGMPCASWAQNNPTSWENLKTLRAGEKIQLLEMNSSKEVSGMFLNVSDAAISLQDKAGQQTVPRQDVRRVKLMKSQHRLRNALIGAGVGAGVFAGIGAAHSDSSWRIVAAAIGAVVGGLGGAVVGALVPSHKTIYRAIDELTCRVCQTNLQPSNRPRSVRLAAVDCVVAGHCGTDCSTAC
jgi:outer membrane lipoprotein SlyB